MPAQWLRSYHALVPLIHEGWLFGMDKSNKVMAVKPAGCAEFIDFRTPADLEVYLGLDAAAVKVRKPAVKAPEGMPTDVESLRISDLRMGVEVDRLNDLVESLRDECVGRVAEIDQLRAQVAELTHLAWQWQAHAETLQARLDTAVEVVSFAVA